VSGILVVDDDRSSQEFLYEILDVKGYDVITVGSAEEALVSISNHPPDLVLMDILLPGMDGLKATQILKNDVNTSHIKVVATTAMAMKGDEDKIFDAGCEACLVKPLDIAELLATVQNCLGPGENVMPAGASTETCSRPAESGNLSTYGATAPRIKVYLVEDELLIRECLSAMLELEQDIELVGEAGDAEQAIEELKSLNADVVLMDLRLPGLDGIEAMRILNQEHTSLGMVAVTSYNGEYFEGAIEAGAVGYILKSATRQQLVQAIRLAVKQQGTLDPSLTTELMRSFSELRTKQRASLLTPRQIEVIKMVANGSRYREIAGELSVNERTVHREMRSILEQLDARDSAHAVSEAYKLRLL